MPGHPPAPCRLPSPVRASRPGGVLTLTAWLDHHCRAGNVVGPSLFLWFSGRVLGCPGGLPGCSGVLLACSGVSARPAHCPGVPDWAVIIRYQKILATPRLDLGSLALFDGLHRPGSPRMLRLGIRDSAFAHDQREASGQQWRPSLKSSRRCAR